MTLFIRNLESPVSDTQDMPALTSKLAALLSISEKDILRTSIVKKSLDARKKRRIVYRYQLQFEVEKEDLLLKSAPTLIEKSPEFKITDPLEGIDVKPLRLRHPPVIIGSGPAGSFAALVLARAGVKSIIVERGEPVAQRLRTVNKLRGSGKLSTESNYCYGEGGAGTFSDGKLSCGRNHPLVRFLFEEWVKFGAPKDILYEAHPHIGTDYLLKVALNTREFLQSQGCSFEFNERFVGFSSGGSDSRYVVQLSSGLKIKTDHLLLATGHSARETYEYLYESGLAMAPKPFAIGARFEHPQEVIDKIQYGPSCHNLSTAEYKLVAHEGDRGIWTFCMCPGGFLLPTSAQEGRLAINGMSYHARNSGFANAAIVVNVLKEDFYRGHVLDGMRWQEALEKKAFAAGGSNYAAPAQKLKDFLSRRSSSGELKSTYKPGVTSARMDKLLPDFVVQSLSAALSTYEKQMRGFISDRALVVGLESKTSAPVTMLRDRTTLQSVSHPGIFPVGEGAGFAGGIVSAALDGARVGRAVLLS